ncbi:MAG: ATP-binding protein [Vicinamibacterales bacterium]
MAHAYEKLGLFYLGRRYDVATRTRQADLVLYDSKDLTTHAVCVGMTGSGKTGLGIGVIEEAAMDGVPVLAIDPKGDLANLLLTFPTLAPSDFAPWVDASVAASRGQTADAFAAQQAAAWKAGLAEWDEDGERIARLRAAAEFAVYTPGSRNGTPLALLKSLAPPSTDDPDAAGERANSVAASLLALAGVEAAAAHDQEQVLLANILAHAWSSGESPDLPWLVQQIQRPAFGRIGVLDLETFYPARDRQQLALRFNAVLASPTFDVWLSGEPMDVGSLLFTPQGRPRVAVVSVAHLDDAARMMVVSLLLNAVLEWTRKQSGTPSLRALIYMDEVAGYIPPVANPPSKAPLLTLLKQARAFGVGIMLSTQNPVDLDYKGLANAGTWFLGKLQTERDKARVLDGLESVAGGVNRAELDTLLSALPGRVFLMHNVHEHGPVTFETRWTMSYLRGPMGREEIRRLSVATSPAAATARTATASEKPMTRAASTARHSDKPVLPAGVKEFYCPHEGSAQAIYEPFLYGAARVQYVDGKKGIDVVSDVHTLIPFGAGAVAVDWDAAEDSPHAPAALLTSPPVPGEGYEAPPADALSARSYAEWTRDFERMLTRGAPLTLWSAPALKVSSKPGESERDFRVRVQQRAREERDEALAALRAKYTPKLARAQEKVRRAEEAVSREQQQSSQQKLQTAVSVGATILGALLGRRAVSATTLGRATTAIRGASRTAKEAEDVTRAGARVGEVTQEAEEVAAELQREIDALSAELDPSAISVERTELKPKRGGVDVQLVTLVWRATDAGS